MTETETVELESAEGGTAAAAEAPDEVQDRPGPDGDRTGATHHLPRAADVADSQAANPPDLAAQLEKLRVDVDSDGEPVLVQEDGTIVDTWRQGYPYQERMPRKEYDREKRLLQIELLKLQNWVKDTGEKIVILFEGRDAAGKGGTIKRFTEHLNPRGASVVALEKPNERERTQWYFQRYLAHLPAAGEIVMFDRSWYNRAGVERVMGFATPAEYLEFMRQAPELERMLVRSGIRLIKLWFSVSQAEQRTRFLIRQIDPVRHWKLSPTDLASLDRWDGYTEAKEAMFFYTDTADAPWTVVKSNDKKRARLEAMRHVLSKFDYAGKDADLVGVPDRLIVGPAADVFEEGEHRDQLFPRL
ncbi:MAG: Polyphosphate kinase 2 [uncultured Corynebacteriales bacterium]|uniref:ADP/GDP-polyphosphate phosphotransferase n=1 Tax=uncultured Mycobacteriales bacterium TaxID=581187 RepID=A0A6J4ITS2_9ACTN|nr:MAG: Polyphosphate kinase 2 [uncultured Corynebacteriales bacterium]